MKNTMKNRTLLFMCYLVIDYLSLVVDSVTVEVDDKNSCCQKAGAFHKTTSENILPINAFYWFIMSNSSDKGCDESLAIFSLYRHTLTLFSQFNTPPGALELPTRGKTTFQLLSLYLSDVC